MITRRSSVWTDISGLTTMKYLDTIDASGAAIEAALRGHSNADVLDCWEGGLQVNSAVSPINLQYPLVQTVAVLIFTDGVINVSVLLPAPDSSILMSDGKTVDATSIADVISACVGHLVTHSGNVVTSYVTGYVTGARRAQP